MEQVHVTGHVVLVGFGRVADKGTPTDNDSARLARASVEIGISDTL